MLWMEWNNDKNLSVLIFLRLVIGENRIIAPHSRGIPNVNLVANSRLKQNTFIYSVPSLVRMERTHLWRVYMLKTWSYFLMRFPVKMLIHKSTHHNFAPMQLLANNTKEWFTCSPLLDDPIKEAYRWFIHFCLRQLLKGECSLDHY